MNLTCKYLKVESTKQVVDVKTSSKSNQTLNLITSFCYFYGIAQGNVDEKYFTSQVSLVYQQSFLKGFVNKSLI
ncbi:hypothetical protein [uncultured Methanobrevibacter sp.]|uniref:hypothetical protein n=1 Tax=uncultured Methanobrevibacter sp. TaxID=253161 RepID=UPI0025F6C0EE|nr:hypothetical protein [uncultured Methanobrevibacter sp.]